MLPLTYDECRARFRRAAATAGLEVDAHPLAARGPFGQELTIDVASFGTSAPDRALVVLSGVHGVEGFVTSAMQCELLGRLATTDLPPDVGVVLVHAVNPWGMAHGRRQNESNVDLNRNWGRDHGAPAHNDAYDEIHAIACPDTPTVPSVEDLMAQVGPVLADHGLDWVRDAITRGQFRHPDGLHYGGQRTEESNRILEEVVPERLASAARVFVVDLHTGHGPRGEITVLSDRPSGSQQDTVLQSLFPRVTATADPDAGTHLKSGPIARGLADALGPAETLVATVEVGTADDLEQLAATYQEQWVHRRGTLDDADHRAVRWAYRLCFTPDDPAWEDEALRRGRTHLDAALAHVAAWAVDG